MIKKITSSGKMICDLTTENKSHLFILFIQVSSVFLQGVGKKGVLMELELKHALIVLIVSLLINTLEICSSLITTIIPFER